MSFLKALIKFWLVVMVIVAGIYFAQHNNQPIEIRIPPVIDFPPLPAYVVYIIMFLLGAATASLFLSYGVFKKELVIHKLHKKLRSVISDDHEDETAPTS